MLDKLPQKNPLDTFSCPKCGRDYSLAGGEANISDELKLASKLAGKATTSICVRCALYIETMNAIARR
jgi:hypothetical protein